MNKISGYTLAPITSAKIEILQNGWKSVHHEMEMIYIAEGKAKIQIFNTVYYAKKGDIYFVNPMEIHSVAAIDDSKHCHYCICFDISLIADRSFAKSLLDGNLYVLNDISSANKDYSGIIKLFEKLYDAIQKQPKTLKLEASAFISLMFSELINNGYIIKTNKRDKSQNFIKMSIDYISEHYTENLTSRQIAEAFFYEQSYFCRVFKKNFGVSFSEYLNLYKVIMAQNMMGDYSKKITEIAAACGFSSHTYFSKCFKKNFGMTPMEYRNSGY